MPKKILIADDDEDVRKSHKFAVTAASQLLNLECVVVEAGDSVEAWKKIKSENFHLIVIDNDFKDKDKKGHLPGIALLQLARREGANMETPIIFCSAESYESLAPMVERFNGVHFPKTGYDMDAAARLFAEKLKGVTL
jgi:CheY-like chemotaxis protein